MKKVILALVAVLVLGIAITVSASNTSILYMPLVFKGGVYFDTPTPTLEPSPTATKRPPTPEPEPTSTPTIIVAEGGNSCAVIFSARPSYDGKGTLISSQLPSVCSIPVVAWREEKMVVIKAIRIKTDTYGCEEDDFGPDTEWPPVDDPCPPVYPIYNDWGYPLWGSFHQMDLPYNVNKVCGYCFECGAPYTNNCVDTFE